MSLVDRNAASKNVDENYVQNINGICIQTYAFKPVKNNFMDHPTVMGLYIPTHMVPHLKILNFDIFGTYASFPNSGIHFLKVCREGGGDSWHVVYFSKHFRRNCYSHLQDRRQRQQLFWNVSNDLPNCMLSHKKENPQSPPPPWELQISNKTLGLTQHKYFDLQRQMFLQGAYRGVRPFSNTPRNIIHNFTLCYFNLISSPN